LSGYLIIVEEITANEHMETYFSMRYRGRGRSKGQYHNQSYHNHNRKQHNSHNFKNYQGNAITLRGQGRSPSQFFRGKSREGSHGSGRYESRERYGEQCYYCNRFGPFEKVYRAKMHDLENKGANIIIEETRNDKLFI
jgi:hypothetical protein